MNRWLFIALHVAVAFVFFFFFSRVVLDQSLDATIPLAIALAGCAGFIAYRQTLR